MKNLKRLLVAGIVIAIGAGLYVYWQYSAAHPSSDDSYLQAGIVTITPETSGRVQSVEVRENQHVTRGDTLFTIDSAALIAAQKAATAQLDQARQTATSGLANIAVAVAQLTSAEAALNERQREFDRQVQLARDGTVSSAARDQAQAALDGAKAGQQAAQAALDAARAQHGQDGAQNAGIRAAEANLALANINLARTIVTAPTSSWISNIDMRVGAFVGAGQPQFSIVADDGWWVEANFKETDLTAIRPGMTARVSIDMYPSVTLTGLVDSIGAGSGASFSLLPAQNATGNWVKVTQRFPVRIALSEIPADPDLQLRVGASVTVIVDTKSGNQAAK